MSNRHHDREAQKIAEKWVARFGYGFHPDTPASEYVNEAGSRFLSTEEAREYEKDMNRLFAIVNDPYKYGVDAMEKMCEPSLARLVYAK